MLARAGAEVEEIRPDSRRSRSARLAHDLVEQLAPIAEPRRDWRHAAIPTARLRHLHLWQSAYGDSSSSTGTRQRGAAVRVIELTAEQIADALLAGDVDADNLDARIALVEAATNGPGDAIGWTRELAARVPLADSS
jgi:hypothetical protein